MGGDGQKRTSPNAPRFVRQPAFERGPLVLGVDVQVFARDSRDVGAESHRASFALLGGVVEQFDLVGISSFTAQIEEAYELADRYREMGVPVVLGGLHVSLMPDEAAEHADSIVCHGAE